MSRVAYDSSTVHGKLLAEADGRVPEQVRKLAVLCVQGSVGQCNRAQGTGTGGGHGLASNGLSFHEKATEAILSDRSLYLAQSNVSVVFKISRP